MKNNSHSNFIYFFVFLSGVVFKNALSEIVEQITEMVIIPKPTRLQLYLVEVPYQQPSCISSHQDLKSPVVAVFQGQSELFEASLSIGSNLSFTWHFSDTNTTRVQQLNSIYGLSGQLQHARSSKQVSFNTVVSKFYLYFII